jgi:hypothetical protein
LPDALWITCIRKEIFIQARWKGFAAYKSNQQPDDNAQKISISC